MKKWLVKKLGGLYSIDEAIDAIKEKDSKEKYRILSDQEKKALIADAHQLENMTLWKVLQKDIEWQANRKMFILSRNTDDIVAGKMFLYALDAIRTRLKSLLKSSAIFNKK